MAAQVRLGAARITVERAKAAGQHFAQRRVLLELGDDVGIRDRSARHGQRFVEQAGRRDRLS
jgi:hypothetical protein